MDSTLSVFGRRAGLLRPEPAVAHEAARHGGLRDAPRGHQAGSRGPRPAGLRTSPARGRRHGTASRDARPGQFPLRHHAGRRSRPDEPRRLGERDHTPGPASAREAVLRLDPRRAGGPGGHDQRLRCLVRRLPGRSARRSRRGRTAHRRSPLALSRGGQPPAHRRHRGPAPGPDVDRAPQPGARERGSPQPSSSPATPSSMPCTGPFGSRSPSPIPGSPPWVSSAAWCW